MYNTIMVYFILGRILLGGYFLMNGYNHFKNRVMLADYAHAKSVFMPKGSVLLTGLMLTLGGVGILFWVYVRVAIAILVIFLAVVTFKMHRYWKISDPMMRMSERVNFYKNLALLGALLLLIRL